MKGFGARGLARARVGAGGVWTQSPMKTMSDAMRADDQRGGRRSSDGDLLFFQFGARSSSLMVFIGLWVQTPPRRPRRGGVSTRAR